MVRARRVRLGRCCCGMHARLPRSETPRSRLAQSTREPGVFCGSYLRARVVRSDASACANHHATRVRRGALLPAWVQRILIEEMRLCRARPGVRTIGTTMKHVRGAAPGGVFLSIRRAGTCCRGNSRERVESALDGTTSPDHIVKREQRH